MEMRSFDFKYINENGIGRQYHIHVPCNNERGIPLHVYKHNNSKYRGSNVLDHLVDSVSCVLSQTYSFFHMID